MLQVPRSGRGSLQPVFEQKRDRVRQRLLSCFLSQLGFCVASCLLVERMGNNSFDSSSATDHDIRAIPLWLPLLFVRCFPASNRAVVAAFSAHTSTACSGYGGPLCIMCEAGYRSRGKRCQQCAEGHEAARWPIALALAVLLAVAAAFLAWRKCSGFPYVFSLR